VGTGCGAEVPGCGGVSVDNAASGIGGVGGVSVISDAVGVGAGHTSCVAVAAGRDSGVAELGYDKFIVRAPKNKT